MDIVVKDNSDIILKNVYNGIEFQSNYNESFIICMRDTGFEFKYNNIWYEAKNGELNKL
jgi:hypothetical protein